MIGRQREAELRQTLFDLPHQLIADERRGPAVHLGLVPVADKRELGEADHGFQRVAGHEVKALGGGVEVVGVEAQHRDLVRPNDLVECRPGNAQPVEFIGHIEATAADDAVLHLDPVIVEGDLKIVPVEHHTGRIVDRFFRGQRLGAKEGR